MLCMLCVLLAFKFAEDPEAILRAQDEHCLSGLIKRLLVSIPNPLLDFSLYDEWLTLATIESVPDRVLAAKKLLLRLPQSHRGLARFLFGFLHRVSLGSEKNKMSAQNLSIVFTPNVLRREKETFESMQSDLKDALLAVTFLIESYPSVWPDSNLYESISHVKILPPVLGAESSSSPVLDDDDELSVWLRERNLDPSGKLRSALAGLFVNSVEVIACVNGL
jgi:hypothetical protein